MASIGTLSIHHKNTVGEYYHFAGAATVTKDGEFRVTVTDTELAEVINGMRHDRDFWKKYGDTTIKHGSKYWGVHGSDYKKIGQCITEGIKLLRAPTQTTEYVIHYCVESQWDMWDNKDGTLSPNGGVAGATTREEGGEWVGQKNPSRGYSQRNEIFSFAVGAQVYEKTTIVRGNNRKVNFRVVSDRNTEDLKNVGPAGLLLSALPHVRVSEGTEIPYSEKAAEFFYSLLVSIAKLGMLSLPYLKDAETIQTAIENFSGQNMLGVGRVTTTKEQQS